MYLRVCVCSKKGIGTFNGPSLREKWRISISLSGLIGNLFDSQFVRLSTIIHNKQVA